MTQKRTPNKRDSGIGQEKSGEVVKRTPWKNRIVGSDIVDPKNLQPNELNWRKHPDRQAKALSGTLDTLGWISDIIVNTQTGRMIDGHLRVELAIENKETEVPVKYVDLSPEEEEMALLTLDPIGAMAEADKNLLEALLNTVKTDDERIKGLMDSIGQDYKIKKEVQEDDYEPPAEIETDIQRGDIYQLGRHRVMCGDSTSEEDVGKLMDGKRCIGSITSPPYAEQRKEQYGGIQAEKYSDWFLKIQSNINDILEIRWNFFLNIKPHAENKQRQLYVFDLVLKMVREWKWLFIDEYCWLRIGIPQQVVNRFKNAFEPVYWFSKSEDFCFYPESVKHESESVPIAIGPGAGDTNAARRQGNGGGAIQGNIVMSGMAYPSNVLDFKQNADAIGHPAAYPIQLPTFFIKCYSVSGDNWYDPFLGSGTTLIACEQLDRICYGMEISPQYCEIICQRWEKLTGKQREKVRGVST